MHLRHPLRWAASAALLVIASPAISATNLVTNGSFESGSFSGWTVTNSGTNTSALVTSYNNTANYPSNPVGENIATDTITTSPDPDTAGSYFAYFSTDTGSNTLSQTVSLLAGHTYSLGLDYYLPANGYNNANGFSIALSLAGQTLGTITNAGTVAQKWYTASASSGTFSADTSGVLSVAFSGLGSPAKDVTLDRIYLIDTTAAVPEPASWTMMILGFGAIGATLRRRSGAKVAAA